eukprot:681006-Rhodomonas_salina.2
MSSSPTNISRTSMRDPSSRRPEPPDRLTLYSSASGTTIVAVANPSSDTLPAMIVIGASKERPFGSTNSSPAASTTGTSAPSRMFDPPGPSHTSLAATRSSASVKVRKVRVMA